MNAHAPGTKERVTNPLFTDRRAGECAWPLWGEGVPIEQKRCCGVSYSIGSRLPYCPVHLRERGGTGTPSEHTAERALLALTLKHGER